MRKENKYDRRRFLGIGTMAIAAANLGRSAEAQSSKATLADRTIKIADERILYSIARDRMNMSHQ